MTVEMDDDGNLIFTVMWSDSAFFNNAWTMSAPFSPDGTTVEYNNCVYKTVDTKDDGTQIITTVYEDGTGKYILNDGAFEWHDGSDTIDHEDCTFVRAD